MKVFARMLVLLFLIPVGGVLAQDHATGGAHDSVKHTMQNVSKFQWMDAPAGLPKGAKVSVLSGNPGEAGPFVLRIQFPANYQIKPHWHPTAENVTVIEGQLYMGTGETFGTEKATMLEKGGFAVMPAKFVHFAFTKAATMIQIHGIGPFAIHYVNPADDPRGQGQ